MILGLLQWYLKDQPNPCGTKLRGLPWGISPMELVFTRKGCIELGSESELKFLFLRGTHSCRSYKKVCSHHSLTCWGAVAPGPKGDFPGRQVASPRSTPRYLYRCMKFNRLQQTLAIKCNH